MKTTWTSFSGSYNKLRRYKTNSLIKLLFSKEKLVQIGIGGNEEDIPKNEKCNKVMIEPKKQEVVTKHQSHNRRIRLSDFLINNRDHIKNINWCIYFITSKIHPNTYWLQQRQFFQCFQAHMIIQKASYIGMKATKTIYNAIVNR